MPSRPLFTSTRTQHAAVAALMVLLFAGSLGAAQWLSAARVVPRRSVSVERLNLDVPSDWTAHPQLQEELALPGARLFQDPQRPSRYLVVRSLGFPEPAPPEKAIRLALEAQLDDADLQTLEPLGPLILSVDARGRSMVYVGVSRPAGAGVARQHLMAIMTTNGQNYWVVYLGDAVGSGENFVEQLNQNVMRLRSLHRSMRLQREG